MERANREVPHYYLATTVDMATAMDWLREHNRRSALDERLLPVALLLKAAALAAREVPDLNGFWSENRFTPGDGVHVEVAVLGVHPQVTATLSADHRATDGVTGARYLTAVDRLLQHPEEL